VNEINRSYAVGVFYPPQSPLVRGEVSPSPDIGGGWEGVGCSNCVTHNKIELLQILNKIKRLQSKEVRPIQEKLARQINTSTKLLDY
jgi:hypothetical protein